ncbi:hypothetical protein C8J57DRAFT_1228765 [Mycena rebaudengoi]|nr:hypothetical protein C8J57DRAFT_1228765 [Mycena rebaudengoi]
MALTRLSTNIQPPEDVTPHILSFLDDQDILNFIEANPDLLIPALNLVSVLISSVAIDWKWEDLEAVERLIRCLPPIPELIINNINAKRADQTKVWKLITILARHTLSAGDTRSFAFISSRSVELLGRKLSDNAEYGNDFATIAPVVLNRSIEMTLLTAVFAFRPSLESGCDKNDSSEKHLFPSVEELLLIGIPSSGRDPEAERQFTAALTQAEGRKSLRRGGP